MDSVDLPGYFVVLYVQGHPVFMALPQKHFLHMAHRVPEPSAGDGLCLEFRILSQKRIEK